MSEFNISSKKVSELVEKYEVKTNERKLKNFLKTFAFYALVLMSVYHFYASGFGTIRDILHRGIHISFVVSLVFIFYDWKKIDKNTKDFKVPYLDIIFFIFTVVTALYLPLLPPEILASRVGNPTNIEIFMGSINSFNLRGCKKIYRFYLTFNLSIFYFICNFWSIFSRCIKAWWC